MSQHDPRNFHEGYNLRRNMLYSLIIDKFMNNSHIFPLLLTRSESLHVLHRFLCFCLYFLSYIFIHVDIYNILFNILLKKS